MNEDVIDDLKQFIVATVSQAMADVATKADIDELRSEMSRLRSEMNEHFDEVTLKLTTIADAHAEQLDDHERRMQQLESHPNF